ncbi:MAG: hypothetical protein ACFFDT_38840 [Candidatus Hodarchaeota archaeon]
MGETIFEFTFKGNKDLFLKKMDTWLTTTTEGNRYRVKTPISTSILTIQRGKGFFTAPIVMEFYIEAEKEDLTDMVTKGYIHPFAIGPLKFGKSSILADAKAGALPRRNGWKDMLKLLDFVGIDQYQHQFI